MAARTDAKQAKLFVVMYWHEWDYSWAPEFCAGYARSERVVCCYPDRKWAEAEARLHGPSLTGHRAYVLPVTQLPPGYYTLRVRERPNNADLPPPRDDR